MFLTVAQKLYRGSTSHCATFLAMAGLVSLIGCGETATSKGDVKKTDLSTPGDLGTRSDAGAGDATTDETAGDAGGRNASAFFRVAPHLDNCQGSPGELCFLLVDEAGQQQRLHPSRLRSYHWEWGRRDLIQTIASGAGETLSYRVINVIDSRVESPERGFLLELSPQLLRRLDRCLYALGDHAVFSTASARLCRDLDKVIDRNDRSLAEFSYTGVPTHPIRLEALSDPDGVHE